MSSNVGKPYIRIKNENKNSFRSKLEAARKSRGFSQLKAGLVVSKARCTINAWEKGRFTPSKVIQKAILDALRDPKEPPTFQSLRDAKKTHHVAWEKDRGWFMRVTIQVGTRVVGKRIKVRLKTTDILEAIRTRDVVLSSYKVMGFNVANVTGTKAKPRQS